MDFSRKNVLFRRAKLQPLKPKDYLKIIVMVGIITVPVIVGLVI